MSAITRVRRVVFGRELSTQEASSEEITPVEGLSALSLDALTSVAYGPEAILIVLAAAGATALHLILPITIAIVALLVILVISYRQVIDAYPRGGGAYAVSRDNFGPRVAKLAGAALIVDYTLTVAVSIAAGVGQLHLGLPLHGPLHRADVPGDPARDHRAQPEGSRRRRTGLSRPDPRVHRRAAGRHRRRAGPPLGPAGRRRRDVARRHPQPARR